MNLIVDTSVWSLFFRRKERDDDNPYNQQIQKHIHDRDCIHLIGHVLQELLDGVKSEKFFNLLVEYLEPFPLIQLQREDFIEAAKLKNACRRKGIQASTVDFLIAAVCIRRHYPLLTSDKDFSYIARYTPLVLIDVSQV